MSKHAVWWSHFWEAPWFVTNDAGTIRNTFLDRSIVTDKNHLGQDIPRPFSANVLGLLNSNKNCQDNFPGLLCEIEAGKSFATGTRTRAFIITPRDSKSNILYNLHVEAIQGELEMVLPGLMPEDLQVITYLPSGSDTDLPEDGGNPKEYQSMYGKFMVQYDPQDTAATSRAGKAAIELWAEYGTEPKARLQWPTLPGQYNPVGPLPVPLGPGTFSNIQASSLVSVILRSSSRSTSTMITSASFAGLRPGFNGVPGCAYVMAPESGQRCVEDYCNCGGTVAPLITARVDDQVSLHCGYSTQPSWNRCPGDPTASPTPTPTPTPSPRPAYAQGVCRMHIQEGPNEIFILLNVNIFDANNVQQYTGNLNVFYKGNAVIEYQATPFGYDIELTAYSVLDGTKELPDSAVLQIKMGAVAKVGYDMRDVTKVPHCNVGQWGGLNLWDQIWGKWYKSKRQADCFWAC
ncbi:hypothetical protein HBI56_092100 [Parastagonospora nodorum]|nr:hypothetical protein HBH53_139250 [Parastagonospora nodorum]KAH3998384.1 hypothetical protein HBI10_133960 [Parastagonospora nodorum]KAH4029849.1 hypothetical protein HBI13_033640 [Parastagonospora nodorum]KAH4034088.1 hypothetical protein HBI09_106010 [Parastagonospora nodorum]KAH4110224.1 hypothetical protein HBH46_013160 [Parastagonospora nodorum]